MAELLIATQSKTNANPAKDLMCWKKGYAIDVREDNTVWAGDEILPKFIVIKCPEISVDDAVEYLWTWDKVNPSIPPVNGHYEYYVYARRQYRMEEEVVNQAISNNGFLTLTRAQLIDAFVDQSQE